METVRILYGAGTISLQAAVHPKCMLGALNMKEERRQQSFVISWKREGLNRFSAHMCRVKANLSFA